MFNNNHFPLHLEILNGIQQSIKQERFKQPDDFFMSRMEQLNLEIESALKVPLITKVIENILYRYRNPPPDDPRVISFEISDVLGVVKYTLPSTEDEYARQDSMWFCPTIFSMFGIEDFYLVLTAVLLERSLVFVSNNLAILSSVILGFKSLIKPFQWCYALIPVLPSPLIDILDTPQPILVGITRTDYQTLALSPEEKLTKTWIFLDEPRVSVSWGQFDQDLAGKRRD